MKVLVPIDTGSAASCEKAVRAILGRDWQEGTTFYLFSVLDGGKSSQSPPLEAAMLGAHLEGRVRRLYEVLLRLETAKPGSTFICQVTAGLVIESIVARAAELSADLIVIGASGTAREHCESVAIEVSKRVNCIVEITESSQSFASVQQNRHIALG